MNRKRFSAKVNKVSDLTYDTDFFEDWQEASWLKFIYESLCKKDSHSTWVRNRNIKEKREKKDGAPLSSVSFFMVFEEGSGGGKKAKSRGVHRPSRVVKAVVSVVTGSIRTGRVLLLPLDRGA